MDIHYNLGNTKFHSSDIIEEKPKKKNEVAKMTVYILKKDKEICGVFSTIEKAREFALNYFKDFNGEVFGKNDSSESKINTEYSYSYDFRVENDYFAWEFFIEDFILDDVISM